MKANFFVLFFPNLFAGIGAIPDAALTALYDHKDLGIHTEMLSDGVLNLIDTNVITNAKKTLYTGRVFFVRCGVRNDGWEHTVLA